MLGGINKISEQEYDAIKNHPTFKQLMNTRPVLLEWVPGFGPADKDLKAFGKLSENEALG